MQCALLMPVASIILNLPKLIGIKSIGYVADELVCSKESRLAGLPFTIFLQNKSVTWVCPIAASFLSSRLALIVYILVKANINNCTTYMYIHTNIYTLMWKCCVRYI